jgi:hypothetical protein
MLIIVFIEYSELLKIQYMQAKPFFLNRGIIKKLTDSVNTIYINENHQKFSHWSIITVQSGLLWVFLGVKDKI